MENMQMKLLFTALFVVVAIAVIILIFKSIKHWSLKSEKIMDSIDSMGNKIENIEKGMDNIKISTEKLMQETRDVNQVLQSIQEKPLIMLEVSDEKLSKGKDTLPLKSGEEDSSDESIRKGYSGLLEEGDLQGQVHDLERALQELRKQKEQLESDINARIRD